MQDMAAAPHTGNIIGARVDENGNTRAVGFRHAAIPELEARLREGVARACNVELILHDAVRGDQVTSARPLCCR